MVLLLYNIIGDTAFYCSLCPADSCIICKKSGGELCCDYCYHYYHIDCVSVMPSIFDSEWCPNCMVNKVEKIISWRPYNDDYRNQYHFHKMLKQLTDVFFNINRCL